MGTFNTRRAKRNMYISLVAEGVIFFVFLGWIALLVSFSPLKEEWYIFLAISCVAIFGTFYAIKREVTKMLSAPGIVIRDPTPFYLEFCKKYDIRPPEAEVFGFFGTAVPSLAVFCPTVFSRQYFLLINSYYYQTQEFVAREWEAMLLHESAHVLFLDHNKQTLFLYCAMLGFVAELGSILVFVLISPQAGFALFFWGFFTYVLSFILSGVQNACQEVRADAYSSLRTNDPLCLHGLLRSYGDLPPFSEIRKTPKDLISYTKSFVSFRLRPAILLSYVNPSPDA